MWNALLERGMLPDFAIRAGIRHLLRKRLLQENENDPEKQQQRLMNFITQLKQSSIALHTTDANQQHYEVPTAFFRCVLGRHMKYSSCYWSNGTTSLDEAEEAMLDLTCRRADLENGMNILELGCGWGSLTLFLASCFPASKITGVSNSKTQREFILQEAEKRGLSNICILTADMNSFETEERFDRVLSVEMFEHMRNYEKLLRKCATFLKINGKLFLHIFTHREFAYLFEVKEESDWMAKYFFTGGMMPSDSLLLYFPEHFSLDHHWRVSGAHYSRTSEAWLANMDRSRAKIEQLFSDFYGEAEAEKWWNYWRVFFMSCAELWGFRNGSEWLVSHYLLRLRS